jgi:hypothetical protein
LTKTNSPNSRSSAGGMPGPGTLKGRARRPHAGLRRSRRLVTFSPLADLLPDRCTPEFRRLQAELGARYSFREAARLLAAFLPCSPPGHASIRNRLDRVAAAVESAEISSSPLSYGLSSTDDGSGDDIVVLIDGAHIRAVPGHQTRHLDVTVGKVGAPGRTPRRFALTPLAADRPLAQIRAALTEQGWTGERPVTVNRPFSALWPSLIRPHSSSNGEMQIGHRFGARSNRGP